MRFSPAALFACVIAGPAALPARAQSVDVHYNVTALGGLSLGDIEATVSMGADGYRIGTRSRPHRLARILGAGKQRSAVEGGWGRHGPLPRRYTMNGDWRGKLYRTELNYRSGSPLVTRREPTDERREVISPDMTSGTLDSLSALAHLARRIAETDTCDGQAAIYDGWRLTNVVARTTGWEAFANREAAPAGRVLNCAFESRMVAGFMQDDSAQDARRPLKGRAWIALGTAARPPCSCGWSSKPAGSAQSLLSLSKHRPETVESRSQHNPLISLKLEGILQYLDICLERCRFDDDLLIR